jgi:ubiquinone/menaquinone biosynthesis C-methylase UbiE
MVNEQASGQPDPIPGEQADAVAMRVAREASYWESVVHEGGRLQQRFVHVFMCPNARWAEERHRAAMRAAIAGRVVLDYGCGDGESSRQLLAEGASHVHGLDLGEKAIALAQQKGLPNASFQVGDAHRLPWPDHSFDVVVGRAILHHLDLPTATRELMRVLRPGGELFFVEPLYHNPLAMLFRWLTPKARTVDEKPLTRAEVLRMGSHFEYQEHGYSLLISMAVGATTSLIPGLGPSNWLLKAADRIDRALASTPLRWWMGNIYLHLRNPVDRKSSPEPA